MNHDLTIYAGSVPIKQKATISFESKKTIGKPFMAVMVSDMDAFDRLRDVTPKAFDLWLWVKDHYDTRNVVAYVPVDLFGMTPQVRSRLFKELEEKELLSRIPAGYLPKKKGYLTTMINPFLINPYDPVSNLDLEAKAIWGSLRNTVTPITQQDLP